jgi:hypothetical protein
MLLTLRRALAALALLSCAHAPLRPAPGPPQDLKSPFTGFESAHYKDPSTWLCLPGRLDACGADLDATELHADGTRVTVRDTPAPGADKVDCFYVYPTVDLSLAPANHDSFSDLSPMTHATVAQAARFRNVCSLYVPLYRQVTIGTYLRGGGAPSAREPYMAVAESDVVDAFLHYMGQWNAGHKIVLIGHSQGAEMTTRLLKRLFDNDPVMRDRLLLAMPIGGAVEVPKGRTVGGSFAHIPVCAQALETSCIVAYRSYAAGGQVRAGLSTPAPGNETVCVNPAELAKGGPRLFTRAFIPAGPGVRQFLHGIDNVATPFVLLRDFYEGHCIEGDAGYRYLVVAPAPTLEDKRVSPIDFGDRRLHGVLGLHILDFQFPQGDLLDLVAQRAARLVDQPR